MSEKSIQAVQDAIAAHIAEDNPGILIDWVVGYALIKEGDRFMQSYISAPASTPAGTYGLASLTVDNIANDLLGDDGDD